jgi:hypothetical protein
LFTFREAGAQISPVTVSRLPENCCSTLFITGYKRLTEGGHQALVLGAFAIALRLLLMGKAFWCGRFLEGKRIVEGERLLKGRKIIAKGELLASLRAETLRKLKRTLYIGFRKVKLKNTKRKHGTERV